MRDSVSFVVGATLSATLMAAQPATVGGVGFAGAPAEAAARSQGVDGVLGFADTPAGAKADADDTSKPEGPSAAYADSALLRGARFSLKQELANRIKKPYPLANNRTFFRVEYEKHFLDNFYLHFDVMETAYWGKDHRAKARSVDVFTESTTRDAYLQFSRANTSVKMGKQILIWGESDAGAVTDVISPRNLSELFFIPLEQSRIGQFMLTVDQFSPLGDWSFFHVPDAQFNQYPEKGTAYFIDPFEGVAEARTADKKLREYGLRWKKTFGRSDISVMAARLIDNDYVIRSDAPASDARPLIRRDAQRFNMLGATFSHVTGSLLFSAEVAKKLPKAFLVPASRRIVQKDVVDTSLRVEYSLGNAGNHSVSLEAVNKRVLDWDKRILPTPKNSNSLVLGWRNSFLNENLTVDWLTVYNPNQTSFQHSLFLGYKLDGRVSLSLDAFYLSVKDRNNDLYAYRGQNNAVFRILYQF